MLVALALLAALLSAVPAVAAERTFVFSAADVTRMVAAFNADVIAHSDIFGRQVRIRGTDVRFFGSTCPVTTPDAARAVSRLRVLDGAARAGALAGRRPNFALAAALQSMGAAAWGPPAIARTLQPLWVAEAPAAGIAGFATAGFAAGDPTGKIDAAASADTMPTFLVDVDVTSGATDPTALVVALTTELPPRRAGKMPKRSECFLLAEIPPADVQALDDLVAATPLTSTTRNRLSNILDDARNWLANGQRARAARAAKRFALEVASRSGAEIPADAAERMVTRALLVTDALGL